MIILFFFLIPTFFGILGAIGKLLYMAINTTVTATGEAIDLHNSKHQKVIANVEPRLIEDSQSVKKTGKLMYVIVRRNEDGSWTQSKPVKSYDEARAILLRERRLTSFPRMIKKVYV